MRRWLLCAPLLLLAACEALFPPSGVEPATSSSTGTSGSGTSGTSTNGSSGSSGSSGCGSPRCPELVQQGLATGDARFEISEGQLYWTEPLPDGGEAVATRTLDGGPITELAFADVFNDWTVAVGSLYWCTATEVWVRPVGGGSATQIAETTTSQSCFGLAVGDGGAVVYARDPSNGSTYDGWLTEWHPGDGVDGGVVLQSGTGQVASMVLSPAALTWSDLNAGVIYSRLSSDGGVLTIGQEGQTNDGLNVVPAGGRDLWWLVNGCQFGFADPTLAGSAMPVFSGGDTCYVGGAAADSNLDVYFVTSDVSNLDGGLYREVAGDDGGNPELLVRSLTSPHEVQLDGPYVYFVNDFVGQPEVLRVAK